MTVCHGGFVMVLLQLAACKIFLPAAVQAQSLTTRNTTLHYPFVSKWRGLHGHAVGLCTAELVAPLWVVTAGHCAVRMLHNETVKVHVELPDATTPNLRRNVVPHSCVHAPSGIDVALCRLAEQVGPTEALPVKLNAAVYETGGAVPPPEGALCVGTYHGMHATGPKPLLTETGGAHIFVDNTNGSGMHAGDSGGAWLVRSTPESEWVLAGVIHGGEKRGGHKHGVASQVSYIGAWINATTGGAVRWGTV